MSSKDSEKSQLSDAQLLFWTFVGQIVVIGIAGCLLWWMGGLNFSGTDSAAKNLLAILALVGTLITATVTFIGFIFKRSFDTRNFNLKSEAEERLKLDTAIKAVELFKNASDSTSSAESAGALFALSSLGQSEFALHLLEELWPKGQIESPSAVWVINNSLQSEESGAAALAATVLYGNTKRLLDGSGGKWWPEDFLFKLPNEIPYIARQSIQNTRIIALLSEKYDYWPRMYLNVDIIALSYTFHEDSAPDMKQSAAAYLAILLEIYDPDAPQELLVENEPLDIEKLRTEIEDRYGPSFLASSEQDKELVEKLDKWVKRAPYFEELRAAEKAKDIEDEIAG